MEEYCWSRKKSWIVLVLMLLFLSGAVLIVVAGMGETKWGSAAKIHLGLDLSGGVSITYQVVDGTSPTTEEMEDAVYKLQQRVYAYSTEAQVVQEGTDRINIQIPGVMDTEEILTDLGKPGTLEFVTEDGETVMEGAQVTGAEAGMGTDDSGNLTYSVVLTLSDEGAKAIAQATAEHQNESIRILYNGEELTTAVITKQITDGECAILGLGTMAEAERLASSIRIGSLQIELEELSSTVVSPQLGTRAIQTSVQAAFVGLALVIFLMMYTYRLPGIVAGFALVFYTCLDLIALSMTGVTLTLPGIAGIILSIGMAVDANVVIYMRIREEITKGLSVKEAILSGYKLALGAILDGNITTLMAGCILYYVGSGPIHGFAVTLMSGIVLSMFTALVITRILIRALYSLGFQQEKWYGRLHDRKLVRFTKGKKWIVPVTIVVILSGPLTMAAHAQTGQNILNFSMDFTGGTQMTLYLNQDITQEELEEVLKPVYAEVAGEENIQVSLEESVDAESNVATVRTAMLTSRQCSQLSDELAELGLAEAENIEFDTVSATITNETRAMSILAVMLALIAMLVYLHFRFRDGCFAVSAILALVHDVLVVLACYAVFRIPVGSSFIACMLTIVGYSINATIVVFDRIRENQKDGLTRQEYVDVSISQTMSRNIYTSLTTIVMVLVLYVHGVESIREFALPIIVGIIAGTWSSICLTGNLWNQLTTLEEEMDLFYDHFLDRIGIGKYFDE